MSFKIHPDNVIKKVVDYLLGDLRSLASETKRKFPNTKELADASILKIRTLQTKKPKDLAAEIREISFDLLEPFALGLESRLVKVNQLSLQAVQRLIQYSLLTSKSAAKVVDMLTALASTGQEELRVLQTTIQLLTTEKVLTGSSLSSALVICINMNYSSESAVASTASAASKQGVDTIFDRLGSANVDHDEKLEIYLNDAVCFLQDLCSHISGDLTIWLVNISSELTPAFGLDLVISAVSNYHSVILKHPALLTVVKEKVCPLVIKLFSPTSKVRSSQLNADVEAFALNMRLMRVVTALVSHYFKILVTECEIFLCLIVKFLDNDKLLWQRILAAEILESFVSQPLLFKNFCLHYDMQAGSNTIFRNIVNSLGTFVQTAFVTPTSSGATNTISLATSFTFRSISIPLLCNPDYSDFKPRLLEHTSIDSIPPIADGYAVTVGYTCILSTIDSIIGAFELLTDESTEDERDLVVNMITNSWMGILPALGIVIEASTNDSILKVSLSALESLIMISGSLQVTAARDSLVLQLCRSCLPALYGMAVLNPCIKSTSVVAPSMRRSDLEQYNIVVTGTPLNPSVAGGGTLCLTSKHLSCMESLLDTALRHGEFLDETWQMVLTTLEHLAWSLGLKPLANGRLNAAPPSEAPSTSVTNAAVARLPFLSERLTLLFENSQHLSQKAISDLLTALCCISTVSMESATSLKEPSLFAVAKLLETGLVNLYRIVIVWEHITDHLHEVTKHSNAQLRCWAAEAITALIKIAMNQSYVPPLTENKELQLSILLPLKHMCEVTYADVRLKQFDCLLILLQDNGQNLIFGWDLLLYVIESFNQISSGEHYVRTAFNSIQLIVTDFLLTIPPECLRQCINAATKFGQQTEDLNISLTSIELLWNLSDFLNQSHQKMCQELSVELVDELGLQMLSSIAVLCTDDRPAVRKMAGQTMFSAITTHTQSAQLGFWENVVTKVLFGLMKSVAQNFTSSSAEAPLEPIMIHHSRDTPQKQWAETVSLTLAGIVKVFSNKKNTIFKIESIQSIWEQCCQFLVEAVGYASIEIKLSAIKCFQDYISLISELSSHGDSFLANKPLKFWTALWNAWTAIGFQCFSEDVKVPPSQQFLSIYFSQFGSICEKLCAPQWSSTDWTKHVSPFFRQSVTAPITADTTAFILVSNPNSQESMTEVQKVILSQMGFVIKLLLNKDLLDWLYPLLFDDLLTMSTYCCFLPQFCSMETRIVELSSIFPLRSSSNSDYVQISCTMFSEKCLQMLVDLYCSRAAHPLIVSERILQKIIQTIRVPLAMKYACTSKTSWKVALASLHKVMAAGLPVATTSSTLAVFNDMWSEFAGTIDDFLFPTNLPPANMSLEEHLSDEMLDVELVLMIKQKILPLAKYIPKHFVARVMEILNKGSIHSAANASFLDVSMINGALNEITDVDNSDVDVGKKLREDLARVCFETLLHFAFSPISAGSEAAVITRLALESLLKRCLHVVHSFLEDDKVSGKCPLPRARMVEMSLVLKAITTLLRSLKTLDSSQIVDKAIWAEVFGLFPCLVELTCTQSNGIAHSLKEAISEYHSFLCIPQR